MGTGFGPSPTYRQDTGSNDVSGTITVPPGGAGILAAGTLTITFSAGFGINGVAPNVMLMDGTGAWAAGASLKITARSTTSFTIAWNNVGVNLVQGSTYKFVYQVIGF